MHPQVLVLDKPRDNLDPESTQELAHLLSELKQRGPALWRPTTDLAGFFRTAMPCASCETAALCAD